MDIKERIVVACQELSRFQGFYNINMDDLAARAGISKRTLYRHYRSKEEVIEATLDEFMARMSNQASSIIESELEPAPIFIKVLENIFTNGQFLINNLVLDDLRHHYPHLWQKVDAFRMERIQFAIQHLSSSSNNELIHEIDPRILTAIIQASVQAVLNPDFIIENNLTFKECALQISKLLLTLKK